VFLPLLETFPEVFFWNQLQMVYCVVVKSFTKVSDEVLGITRVLSTSDDGQNPET
jgi:hypothetical protein